MDLTVYWFMLPVCIGVASAAMFSGISGAAMLMPVFLVGFPLLGVPTLTTVAAVGMSLFLETSGFGTGLYRYVKRGLVDADAAKRIAALSLPAAVVGALAARYVPVDVLRIGYGVAMVGLAAVLVTEPETAHGPGSPAESGDPIDLCDDGQDVRELVADDGAKFRYCPTGLGSQRFLSAGGAVLAGMISTGVGEATLPLLVRRSRFPIPVAAATSTVVVAATVAGAALTHHVQLAREGGFSAIPWNLLLWAVPGAIIGAYLGTHLQGRIPERAARYFFSVLFLAIGVTFLVMFTVLDGVLAVD